MVHVLSIVLKNALRKNKNVFRKWRFVLYALDIVSHNILNAQHAFKGKHDNQRRGR
jgi:hypothetical protein